MPELGDRDEHGLEDVGRTDHGAAAPFGAGLRLDGDLADLADLSDLPPFTGELDDDLVDLALVHADDAYLDTLGAAVRGEGGELPDDELAALLTSWRDEVDAEPIPADLVDERLAVVTVLGAKARKRRRPRLMVPVAAAAAVFAVAFTGAATAAKDARPGDALWGLTKVLYSEHARSVEAAASVRQDLKIAQTALSQGKLSEARVRLDEAGKGLPEVSTEDGQADLAAQHADLLSQLPGNPADGVQQPPSAIPSTVKPTPTTSPSSPSPKPTTEAPTTPPSTSSPVVPPSPQPTTETSAPTSAPGTGNQGGTGTPQEPRLDDPPNSGPAQTGGLLTGQGEVPTSTPGTGSTSPTP